MMASIAEQPPPGDDWLYRGEMGRRAGAVLHRRPAVRILSRAGNRCEQQYPELSVLPHYVKASSAILDGEIAVLDANGRSSF